jgi:hypothetical protein
MSVTLSANSLGDRESTATVAPAAARVCAVTRPMPRPPPVTAAICPYRSMDVINHFQSSATNKLTLGYGMSGFPRIQLLHLRKLALQIRWDAGAVQTFKIKVPFQGHYLWNVARTVIARLIPE